jgi:hypothetical protein
MELPVDHNSTNSSLGEEDEEHLQYGNAPFGLWDKY